MTEQDFLRELQAFMDEWQNDSPTIKVHTSGSTGTPKAMQVEKKRMIASARRTCDFLKLQKDDTALLCMPLQYIAGKMMVIRS
ncbi:MAG: AMP-binding protein, partial [Bacteroides sp.]|nr:AMP-binding protein [Bacteroides sp.]